MTDIDFINNIYYKYLNRSCWQSDIARQTGLLDTEVSYILNSLGFYRNKRIRIVQPEVVLKDPYIKRILDRVNKNNS